MQTDQNSNSNISIAVDEHAVAKALSISVHWLRKDRIGARLVPFYRISGNVRYNLSRVAEALASMEEGGPETQRARRRTAGR